MRPQNNSFCHINQQNWYASGRVSLFCSQMYFSFWFFLSSGWNNVDCTRTSRWSWKFFIFDEQKTYSFWQIPYQVCDFFSNNERVSEMNYKHNSLRQEPKLIIQCNLQQINRCMLSWRRHLNNKTNIIYYNCKNRLNW